LLAGINPNDAKQIAATKEIIKIYEGELGRFSGSG
jgi:hypothetical protein